MPKSIKKLPDFHVCTSIKDAQWASSAFGGKAQVDILLDKSGVWKTVADVYPVDGIDAEDIASYLVLNIRERQQSQPLLHEVIPILEKCSACPDLAEKDKKRLSDLLPKVRNAACMRSG